jgi:hypothetical protein
MPKEMARRVVGAFIAWMKPRMEPSSVPAIEMFAARCRVLIDSSPTLPESPSAMNGDGIRLIMKWVFSGLMATYANELWCPTAIAGYKLLLDYAMEDLICSLTPPSVVPTPSQSTDLSPSSSQEAKDAVS